jgi:WD40 repeat protein
MALIGLVLLLVSTVGVFASVSEFVEMLAKQPRSKPRIGLATVVLLLNVGAHPFLVSKVDHWLSDRRTEQWRAKKESEQRKGSFQHSGKANVVVFSPDGLTLASAIVNEVQLWDVASEKLNSVLRGHRGVVTAIALTPDGRKLLTSSDDHTVRLWGVSRGSLLHTFERQADWVSSVAVSRDGQTVAFGGEQGNVKLWDLQTYQMQRSFFARVATIHALAFSPTDDVLAVAGAAAISLWNPRTGEALPGLPESQGRFNCLAFTHDGQRLIAGGGDVGVKGPGVLIEWNFATREKKTLPTEHTKMLQSLALSSDDGYLATSAWDNQVLIHDLTTGEPVSRGKYSDLVRSVGFNPVTHSLAIAGINSIRILYEPFPPRQHFRAADSEQTDPSIPE